MRYLRRVKGRTTLGRIQTENIRQKLVISNLNERNREYKIDEKNRLPSTRLASVGAAEEEEVYNVQRKDGICNRQNAYNNLSSQGVAWE